MQQVTVACLVHTISKIAILGRTIIVYNYIYNKWVEEITLKHSHTQTEKKKRKEGKGREKWKKRKKTHDNVIND